MPLERRAGLRAAAVLVAAAAAACNAGPRTSFEIAWPGPNADERAPVALHGLTGPELTEAVETGAAFAVFVDGEGDPPPVLGAYSADGDALLFQPRFPWKRGLSYRARFRTDAFETVERTERVDLESIHLFPAEDHAPSTLVSAVYPSGDVLPENLLRLYVHFSAPMSRGNAYEHVHVLDAAGDELDQPFLEVTQELWDPTTTRLTLLFDPGRIKRGLVPNLQLGSPLVRGRVYTLVIDANWIDARGVPLADSYERRFHTTEPDHTQPDADEWLLALPAAGTRDPLVVTFTEALDHALLERVLTVRHENGLVITGGIDIRDGETRWSLRPERPWEPGAYRLETETLLEDIAGNSLERPFEVALTEVSDRNLPPDRHLRVFEIR